MWRISLFALAALLACACANEDMSAAAQVLEPEVAAPNTVTLHSLFHGKPGTFRAQTWDEGPWGECSQRCGSGGVRSRTVTCQKIIAYIFDTDYSIMSIVPDKECFDLLGPKPEVFQKCNEDKPCPTWLAGHWIPCDKSISPDKECFEMLGLKPEVFQKCNEDKPCPTWFVGHWKPCNKLCDEGKQTRQVVCYQKKDGRIEVLNEKDCTEKKPDEEQPCMLQHCDGVDWVVSGWSGCDSCTSKNQTRVVVCMTKDKQVLNDSFCSHHNRPVDHKECNKEELPACEAKWFADQWSKCSAKCGDGVQTRSVFCGMYYIDDSGKGVAVLDHAKCTNLTKYQDTKPCTVPKEECPSQWFAEPWNECTEKCGGGEQYRRVMCFRGDKEALDCDGTTILDSSQVCNTGPCDPDNLLPVSQTSEVVMGEEPREKLDCRKTKFGCCPDMKTSALRSFDVGCLKPRTCKSPESIYGCCPDGLSPAEGPNNEGCPSVPCAETLFGCCTSDKMTAAQGNDQDGCPSLPSPCDSSVYGCCADNETEATGPEKKGCPETHPGEADTVVTGELGQPLLVHCLEFWSPLPAVFWFRGHEGIDLLYNDTVYEVSGEVLLIRSLSIEALGLYTCLAHIGEGMPVSWRVVVQANKPEGTFTENDSIAVETTTTAEMINSTNTTATEPPRPLFSDLVVPVNCIDEYFAPCDQIVRSKFCRHNYYSKFCCKSCVEAGQLDPQKAELQAGHTL